MCMHTGLMHFVNYVWVLTTTACGAKNIRIIRGDGELITHVPCLFHSTYPVQMSGANVKCIYHAITCTKRKVEEMVKT